ncbi:MAG: DUF2867 domain-containing protein [Prevotellaceae bacterium]|jgi:hypothetical protein|nr:DUF2867 domain-containing protein [Prevotellaceae bacterium]
MKIKKSKISADSLTKKYLPSDYNEAYEIIVKANNRLTPDNMLIVFWTDFPAWVRWLLYLRDMLVKPFGLKGTDDNYNSFRQNFTEMVCTSGNYKQMSIPAKRENETVIQLADRHLTTELSCRIENILDNKLKISIITLVHYHNTFGKVYFNVIKPFHKIIVKTMMKRTVANLK